MPRKLLNVSHYQQQQTSDCLAACSAMVLDYLNISTSYSRLLRLLKVKSIGAPFSNVGNLSRLRVGIEFDYGEMAILYARIDANHPVIVAVDTSELSYWDMPTYHALVVIGYDDHFIYVNDPDQSFGKIAIDVNEFALAWLERDYMFATLQK